MFRIKYSREILLKLFYLVDVMDPKDITPDRIIDDNSPFYPGVNRKERVFIKQLLDKVIYDREEIDKLISENLVGWKLERLLPVDRALLRLGVAESFINDQKAVIIDDIIRIAKKYGTEDSYKIINAILDKVIKSTSPRPKKPKPPQKGPTAKPSGKKTPPKKVTK